MDTTAGYTISDEPPAPSSADTESLADPDMTILRLRRRPPPTAPAGSLRARLGAVDREYCRRCCLPARLCCRSAVVFRLGRNRPFTLGASDTRLGRAAASLVRRCG